PKLRARLGHHSTPALQMADPLHHRRTLRLQHRSFTPHRVEPAQHLQRATLPPDHEAQRREQRREAQGHPNHARLPPHHAAFRHARSRALRDRGFDSTSAAVGATGFRVSVSPSGRPRQRHTGSSGGQMQARLQSRNASFTRRSSNEWYERTTRTPPGSSASRNAGSARSSAPSSSFTAILSAWKIRALSCTVSRPPYTRSSTSTRSSLVRNGASARRLTTSAASRRERRSSPYRQNRSARSRSGSSFNRSAAVGIDRKRVE